MAIGKSTMILSKENLIKLSIVLLLIFFAVYSRLVPHPANFAPIAALALFGGAILPRKWALVLPLGAMIISDLIIGLHPLIFFTWGSFMFIAFMSNKYLKKINPLTVGAASLSASIFFFVVSNFGVWLEGRLYSYTIEGLISCYYNAIPFFRNTLLGDLFYSTVLFGAYAIALKFALYKKDDLSLKI